MAQYQILARRLLGSPEGGRTAAPDACTACCTLPHAARAPVRNVCARGGGGPPARIGCAQFPCGNRESQYLCDPQWFRDTASRGPTTIVAPKSQFGTDPSDHAVELIREPHVFQLLSAPKSFGPPAIELLRWALFLQLRIVFVVISLVHEERMDGETQTDQEGHDENVSTVAQGEQEKSTTDGPKSHVGETNKMEEWVDNVAQIEQDEGSNQIEKETATNKRDIVMRSGPEQPAQESLTYTGKSVCALIEIREINRVTYFLPKIDPVDKEREHQDIRDKAECQLQVYDQWHRFRTDYRLSKISSLKTVEEFAQEENKLFSWGETNKVSELLQRRDFFWYKLVELHMREVVAENWKEFHKDKPSANQDLMAIRLLEAELAQTRKSINLFQARVGKCVCLVTLAMSLFDLQDVCIAIGSLATLDLPMVVDLIGIYGLKGQYSTLTTTDWFLQALSVIPRGSWGDVARRFTMIRWAGPEL
ncbi:putative glutathione S-transferase [Dorcoceras hygrometricum]|uniref:Putative glutathione S-transferase n=1 Tax=Dorcoceras hygrometricum TaxID=472368 RepID=A0A2Z7C3P7_9LAMI|nr:putative glutathione S-transferase [Dorcoceras hygrometricum]